MTKRENKTKIGIVISCQQESPCNATISKADPLGVATQKFSHGKGETIIGINGLSVIDATYAEIVAAIRTSKETSWTANGIIIDRPPCTIKILIQEATPGKKEFEPIAPLESCCLLL